MKWITTSTREQDSNELDTRQCDWLSFIIISIHLQQIYHNDILLIGLIWVVLISTDLPSLLLILQYGGPQCRQGGGLFG